MICQVCGAVFSLLLKAKRHHDQTGHELAVEECCWAGDGCCRGHL